VGASEVRVRKLVREYGLRAEDGALRDAAGPGLPTDEPFRSTPHAAPSPAP
jgi:hypothetical protein